MTTRKPSTNLKVVERYEKPEQLTYEQIQDLAARIAFRAWDDKEIQGLLLILMAEISEFVRDTSHVEGIAITVRDAVFAKTIESDRAEKRFVASLRAEFQKGGTGR